MPGPPPPIKITRHAPKTGNGKDPTVVEHVPQARGAPAEPKAPQLGADAAQIEGAIRRAPAAGPRGHNTRPAPQVITRLASEIRPEPISWLWKYWLARGKFHILAGVPETGKTTIALSYAAIVSSGGEWPDGTRAPVGSVLIWTAEDDADDWLSPFAEPSHHAASRFERNGR
jgi:hypothetical protein